MIRFEQPLTEGRLVRRYKRFLADVELAGGPEKGPEKGKTVVAHCANSGSMLSVDTPGSRVWLSPNQNPKAKLDWRWELIEVGGALVGINTARPNRIVENAVASGSIDELAGYGALRREVKYGGNSRIDLLLEEPTAAGAPAQCYVEVKNVTLSREPGLAEFPDAVTARGTKHLKELSDMVAAGHRAVMFYLVQRGDCARATVAADIDPAYAAALGAAMADGVEVLCYACEVTPERVAIARRLPFAL